MKIRVKSLYYIDESEKPSSVRFIHYHPKCKVKMERKLMSINELRIGELYLIATDIKNRLQWTGDWKYVGEKTDEKTKQKMFIFKSESNLYQIKDIDFLEDEMNGLIFHKEIAKQKE